MKRVNCLGVLVVDSLSGPLEAYPVPKVRTQVTTERVTFLPGGGAANTGAALARMGVPTRVFSKVGDDANGAFVVRELEAAGVDCRGVRLSPDDTTPFTFVGVHPDGDRTFIHTPGANLTFSPADVDREELLSADMLLYQDYWVKPAFDGAPAAELLREAKLRGVMTLMDECWGLGPDRKSFELALPHCDLVLPSADDMAVIYPGASPEDVADILLSRGAGAVVLKLGADGCLVARRTGRLRVPALEAKVVDTTGAGDCWDAGLLAGLVHGEDLPAAALLGNACAAFCIEAVGGAAGVPGYEAVKARAAGGVR